MERKDTKLDAAHAYEAGLRLETKRNFKAAFEQFTISHELGHDLGSVRLADYFINGYNACPIDLHRATAILTQVHRGRQLPRATSLLARSYCHGWGIARDKQMAQELIREAVDRKCPFGVAATTNVERSAELVTSSIITIKELANGGDLDALFAYANVLATGKWVTQDKKEAQVLLQRLADVGHAGAQCQLGDMLCDAKADTKEITKWFTLAYEQGDAYAAYSLGWIAEKENKEIDRAREWYEKAVTLGWANACVELARIIRDSNPLRSVQLSIQAGEMGLGTGYLNAGVQFEHGNGVAQDKARALELYKMAAACSDTLAMRYVGQCYWHGRGTTQDVKTAIVWFERAVSAGDDSACEILADIYSIGEQGAIAQDLNKTVHFFKLAAERGIKRAVTLQHIYALAIEELGNEQKEEKDGSKPLRPALIDLYLERRAQGTLPDLTAPSDQVKIGMAAEQRADHATALAAFSKACECPTDADALWHMAVMFINGYGCEVDMNRAVQLLEKAARLGHRCAMRDLGVCYEHGHGGLDKKPRRAAQLYATAILFCDGGAQACLGLLYHRGVGVAEDRALARELFLLGEASGDVFAIRMLGDDAKSGSGQPMDMKRSLAYYQKAHDMGDVVSTVRLANMHFNGNGCDEDEKKALELYRIAADKGNANGQFEVGECLAAGHGCDVDKKAARQAYERAANLGSAKAMWKMGLLTHKTDAKSAYAWFTKAVEAGCVEALDELGWALGHGLGCVQDDAKACDMYERAIAEAKSIRAQVWLGVRYERGQGRTRDCRKAAELFAAAAKNGSSDGALFLASMCDAGKHDGNAVEWFEKAADLGSTLAMRTLAERFAHGSHGVTKNWPRAEKLLLRAEEAGDHDATLLRRALRPVDEEKKDSRATNHDGKQGDARDAKLELLVRVICSTIDATDQAAEFKKVGMSAEASDVFPDACFWYEKAWQAGDPEGARMLGVMYFHGRGVKQDKKKAVELWTLAMDAGDMEAAVNLGKIYHGGVAGSGVAQDRKKAYELFSKAAEQMEDGYALHLLALYHHEGEAGLQADEKQAAAFFRRAADKGHAASMIALGSMYQHGNGGLQKDMSRAREFYEKAGKAGKSEGYRFLGNTFAHPTDGSPTDMDRARKYWKLADGDSDNPLLMALLLASLM